MATLVKAGMPITRSLDVLGRQERNALMRRTLESVAAAIRSGASFSDGLRQHPTVFTPLYVDMVRAGEAGGVLAAVLERLALFAEKSERARGKLKAAMIYPCIIVTVAVGIVATLLTVVVPKFEEIFAGLLKGEPLPALTRAVITLSSFVSEHAVLAAGLATVVGIVAAIFHRTPRGAGWLERVWLRTPLLGDFILKAAVARFARTFGVSLSAGVPILHALAIARDTAGSYRLAEAIAVVRDRIKSGDTVSRSIAATRVFPDVMASMVEVGEDTGALSEMLGRVADAYDDEVDFALAGLTTIIEPVMIVIMAVVVGTIVVALFLPIVKIIQLLS